MALFRRRGAINVVGSFVLNANGTMFLAACRSYPPKLAGRWELPGGKVEAGEKPHEALTRELREELHITAEPMFRLDGEVDLGGDMYLQVWAARIVSGTPVAGNSHRAVKWLSKRDAWSVDWLDSNVKFVKDGLTYLR